MSPWIRNLSFGFSPLNPGPRITVIYIQNDFKELNLKKKFPQKTHMTAVL